MRLRLPDGRQPELRLPEHRTGRTMRMKPAVRLRIVRSVRRLG